MNIDIHYSCAGTGPSIVLLHGMFGSHTNLGALARALAPAYQVYSLDLPNHGRSGWLEWADLPMMADFLLQWLDQQGLHRVTLVGHSLGGKIAMELALSHPDRVNALVVADIAPVVYTAGHDGVFAALRGVEQAHCTSRAQAEDVMKRHIQEPGVIPFLLMSLQRNADGEYAWRFNLRGIEHSYGASLQAPSAGASYGGPTLFIKGGDSPYIQKSDEPALRRYFPAAQLQEMPGCDHWLHARQPRQFNRLVMDFLTAAISAPVSVL